LQGDGNGRSLQGHDEELPIDTDRFYHFSRETYSSTSSTISNNNNSIIVIIIINDGEILFGQRHVDIDQRFRC
jgi:hypothetical protein